MVEEGGYFEFMLDLFILYCNLCFIIDIIINIYFMVMVIYLEVLMFGCKYYYVDECFGFDVYFF